MSAPDAASSSIPMHDYFIISADCHVLEPPDLWEKRIEAKLRHRIPRLEVDANGRKWLVVEGRGKRVSVTSLWTGKI